MTDPVERVAQWVIEARRRKEYTAECRHPFSDAKCDYNWVAALSRSVINEDDHTLETCAAKLQNLLRLGGWPLPYVPIDGKSSPAVDAWFAKLRRKPDA
jgi:hypothetical protein